jgi:hypothetical protein
MPTAGRRFARLWSITADPVALVAGLIAIGLAVAGLRRTGLPLPHLELATAGVVALFFGLAALRSPATGLVLLYLVPPVFNGEDSRPYFWLFEFLVYATLAAGVGTCLVRRVWPRVPQAPLLLLLVVATVVSVPLTLRELWLQVQVSPWRELVEGLRRSDLWEDLFYARTVLNVASGAGLAILAANQAWSRPRLVRLAVAATLAYTATALLGLWCYWFPAGDLGTFVTVWLGGDMMGGFQGLGFNVSYFAQYALVYVPLLVLALIESTSAWARVAAVLGLTATTYMIPATRQRAACILFALELVVLLVAWLVWWRRARSMRPAWLAVPLAVVLVALGGGLVMGRSGADVVWRLRLLWAQGDTYRWTALSVARRMFFDEPVLGIGSGRFAGEFARYDERPNMQAGSLSAHDIYAQFLAEQGIVGLACFVALVGAVLLGALRRAREPGETRTALVLLLVSLGLFLAYGTVQHTLLMRSMQAYFWITLGLLMALSPAPRATYRWPRWSALVAVLLILGAVRVQAVWRRPVPIGYVWGFHRDDDADPRWTRGSAILNPAAQGTRLTLAFSFPVAHLTRRPQRVTVLVDGAEVRRLIFPSPTAWEIVDVPIGTPRGAPVLVQVRVAYSFVPADLGVNEDTRRLGILMKTPSWP